MSEKEHRLTATLDSEMWNRFVKVKEDTGMKWNSNVLRYLISKEYHKVVGSGRVPIPFTEKEERAIKKFATKLGMTPQQLLEKAVTDYLKERGVDVKS